ncbi:MAG TPA: NDP-sugar synthase, partial [Vampirovibrionales bacterium]
MRAMILAAGVGSRLAPITDQLPKPLIPVLGKPVLSRILELLIQNGFNEFIANTHYLGDKIEKVYADQITIKHEDKLSGVAGGIRVCADFLREGKDTFAIIMGDALTDINLKEMLQSHKSSGAQATIAIKQVQDTTQFGVVCFDDKGTVTSFQEKPKAEDAMSNWANTGVYLFEASILDQIPSEEEAPEYDVAHDLFPKLLSDNISINTYKADAYWADLGTHEQYRQTLFDALEGTLKVEIPGQPYSWGYLGSGSKMSAGCFVKNKAYIGRNCQIGRTILKGHVVIEDNCVIEDGVVLENCLIMSGATVKADSKLKEMNVAPHQIIYPIEEPNLEIIQINPISSARALERKKDNAMLSFLKEAAESIVSLIK